MSILALPRHHRHDPAEQPLVAPRVRPRAVDPTPLPCKPGTSRIVLAELIADRDTVRVIQAVHAPHAASVQDAADAEFMRTLGYIEARLDAAPALRHEEPVAEALAELAAMLDQPGPRTDWLYLLGAVESAELTSWARLRTNLTQAQVTA